MKMIPADEVPKKKYKNIALQAFIQEFIDSDYGACIVEFEDFEYTSTQALYASLWTAVRKCGHDIRTITQDGKVYLYKPASQE
jgi:hypothetical protein